MSGSTISTGLVFKGYDKKAEVELIVLRVLIEMDFLLAVQKSYTCGLLMLFKSKKHESGAYLEPYQTSNMERFIFLKTINKSQNRLQFLQNAPS